MTLRRDRLADQVRDVLAECFQAGNMQDPRLESVTITAVKLSKDFQIATVYYRTYDSAKIEAAKSGLESAQGLLKRALARTLSVRRVPALRFFYDETLENAARIETLLREV